MHAPTAIAISLLAASGAAARDLPAELRGTASPMPAAVLATAPDGALDEGRALLAAANPVQAVAAFRTALARDPASVAALNGLAIAYDRLGRADLARQHFEQALALEPAAADIAYNLGWSLVKAGQHRDAIAPLQRAAAGPDQRIGNAARRALAMVAARLEAGSAATIVVAAASPPPASARIDVVASGEAVLVLAAAPVRAAPIATGPRPSIPAPSIPAPSIPTPVIANAAAPAAAAAPITMVLASRLGDAASLTIPATVAPAGPASHAEPGPPLASRPPVPVRQAMPAVPAAPPSQSPSRSPPQSLPPAVVAARAPMRAIAVPASAWAQAPASAAMVPASMITRRQRPDQPAGPQPADPKAEIRLAIARLEWLLERLGARDA